MEVTFSDLSSRKYSTSAPVAASGRHFILPTSPQEYSSTLCLCRSLQARVDTVDSTKTWTWRNPKTHGALCRSTWMALSSSPFADHGHHGHHGHHDKCIASALSCPLFLRAPGSSGNFERQSMAKSCCRCYLLRPRGLIKLSWAKWDMNPKMNQRSQCFFVSQILTVHWKEEHQTKKKLSCFLKIQIFQLGIKDHQTIRMYIELGAFGSSASWYFRTKDIALQGFELCKQNDWSAC